jgi:signal transduction histidine kinase
MTEAVAQFAKTFYAREQSLREDVQQGREALAQSLEARDQFISFAMHELRSPIASILLGLQLMKKTAEKGPVDGDRITRLLEAPLRQLERLTGMVDTLLDVARIENARLVLDIGRHDLCAIAHDVTERLAGLARAAGSSVKVTACEPVYGDWDRVRLEQVITNLVTNAVKYGKGQPIDITVHRTPKGLATLAVSDRGIGIAPEDRERIFRRYERISEAHHRESLGLGLYIVREIVAAHHGRVQVESEPGQGSTFTVLLPTGERH